MHDRIKMMAVLCPAWANTYQSMCLGFNPEQLKLIAFQLSNPKKEFSLLPTCRTTARVTGIPSPSWKLFTDWSFKRQDDETDVTGWGITVISSDNVVRTHCDSVTCDPRHPAFSRATSYSNNTTELTGFAEVLSSMLLATLVDDVPSFETTRHFWCNTYAKELKMTQEKTKRLNEKMSQLSQRISSRDSATPMKRITVKTGKTSRSDVYGRWCG